ncbi:MAG: hypothetical protein MK098_07565 [Marinovum sp.]|nr:hypothetical protein [Marinovum sp.]
MAAFLNFRKLDIIGCNMHQVLKSRFDRRAGRSLDTETPRGSIDHLGHHLAARQHHRRRDELV